MYTLALILLCGSAAPTEPRADRSTLSLRAVDWANRHYEGVGSLSNGHTEIHYYYADIDEHDIEEAKLIVVLYDELDGRLGEEAVVVLSHHGILARSGTSWHDTHLIVFRWGRGHAREIHRQELLDLDVDCAALADGKILLGTVSTGECFESSSLIFRRGRFRTTKMAPHETTQT